METQNNTPKIIAIVLGVLLAGAVVLWYLETRKTDQLQEQILKLNNELIQKEDDKQEQILKATQEVEKRIKNLEYRQRKAKEDEKDAIDNFSSLDAAAAKDFLSEYTKQRGAGDSTP